MLLPTSVQLNCRMLQLPNDWRRIANGWLAQELLSQVEDFGHRTEITRHIIRAGFDVGLVTTWHKLSPPLRIIETPRLTWHIGGFRYVYLPFINDEVLHDCAEQKPPPSSIVYITPSDIDRLFDLALQHFLGPSTPSVLSLYSHITLRLHFSSIDAGWPAAKIVREFLTAYNKRVISAGADQSILIDIPTYVS